MKYPLIPICLATLLLGFVLGRLSVPAAPDQKSSEAGKSNRGQSANPSAGVGSAGLHGDGTPHVRTRVARDRMEDGKPKEPRVSIPLSSVVNVLKNGQLGSPAFDSIVYGMDSALTLLGASEAETKEIRSHFEKAKSGILAMERNHVRLAETSEHMIRFDMSGMREPVETIIRQLKDEIRMSLPADMAEGLVSAIDWEQFYPTDEKSAPKFEITRDGKGGLTAWVKSGIAGHGIPVPSEYADDGTPLPADKIFRDKFCSDRWETLLKGITILPKDQE